MGVTAENLVEKYNLSREEQDAYALESQEKAVAAIEGGKFTGEIVPVEMKGRKGEVNVFDKGRDAAQRHVDGKTRPPQACFRQERLRDPGQFVLPGGCGLRPRAGVQG